jgi:hypothetical protein
MSLIPFAPFNASTKPYDFCRLDRLTFQRFDDSLAAKASATAARGKSHSMIVVC